jgi:hypothetical protein
MTNSTHLDLPYLDAAQAQKHVTHNDALRMLDALVQLAVAARNVTSVPAAPAEGGRWLVGAGATGAFAGNANNVAAFQDGIWRFFVPQKGWCAYVEGEGIVVLFDGTAWNDLGLSFHTLQNLTRLGIGTTADATNMLAAKLNTALFTAKPTSEGGTGDLRITLNKSAAPNTVSQLYQDNYSGRAEIGLTGDDSFHFKVSPDGSTWYDALILSSAAGDKFAPAGGLVLGSNSFFVTTSSSGSVTPLSQVQGTGGNAAFLAARFSNDANASRVFFAKSRGASIATQGAIALGDDLGGASFAGSDGSAMRHGATVKALATGSATATGVPTKIEFDTSDGTAAPSNRMEIGPNGAIGVGVGYDTSNLFKFSVSGAFKAAIDPAFTGAALSGTNFWLIGTPGLSTRFVVECVATSAQFVARRANGSSTARTALLAGDNIYYFTGFGHDGSADGTAGAGGVAMSANENWNSTSHGTYVAFYTVQNGTIGQAEKARVDNAGNLLVGNTTGTDKLTVSGNAVPFADNTYSCGKSGARWSAIWSANGTIQTSDERDKTIVERFASMQAVAIIDAVQPIKFRWKVGGQSESRNVVEHKHVSRDDPQRFSQEVDYTPEPGKRIHAGFVAQEMKAAMDANGGDFGAWGLEDVGDPASRQFLRPDQLISILWEALRETRRDLADLKAHATQR